MSEKVVFLAFKNENLEHTGRDFLTCKHCLNKTYIIVWQGTDKFPLVQCAACATHIGYLGWADSGNGDKPQESAS